MSFGHCPRDKLCDACLEQWFAQLRGVAAKRGETWADQIRERRGRVHADDLELVIELAKRRVADIADDARLRDRLAGELVEWMTRRVCYFSRSCEEHATGTPSGRQPAHDRSHARALVVARDAPGRWRGRQACARHVAAPFGGREGMIATAISRPLHMHQSSICNRLRRSGLKIRVSLVQFRPWALEISQFLDDSGQA